MITRAHPTRDLTGLTLVEAALVLVMLTIVLGGLALSTRMASDAFEEGNIEADLSGRAHHVLQSIAGELASAGRDGISPEPLAPLGSSSLEYRLGQGALAGVIQWGPLTRIELALEDGELDDGIDNNGNGLADERVILRTDDVGGTAERTLALCHWVRELAAAELPNNADDDGNLLVDEPGFVFSVAGDLLTIRLTLERLDARHRPLTKSVVTSVRIRN